jgi:hypothetical protein
MYGCTNRERACPAQHCIWNVLQCAALLAVGNARSNVDQLGGHLTWRQRANVALVVSICAARISSMLLCWPNRTSHTRFCKHTPHSPRTCAHVHAHFVHTIRARADHDRSVCRSSGSSGHTGRRGGAFGMWHVWPSGVCSGHCVQQAAGGVWTRTESKVHHGGWRRGALHVKRVRLHVMRFPPIDPPMNQIRPRHIAATLLSIWRLSGQAEVVSPIESRRNEKGVLAHYSMCPRMNVQKNFHSSYLAVTVCA